MPQSRWSLLQEMAPSSNMWTQPSPPSCSPAWSWCLAIMLPWSVPSLSSLLPWRPELCHYARHVIGVLCHSSCKGDFSSHGAESCGAWLSLAPSLSTSFGKKWLCCFSCYFRRCYHHCYRHYRYYYNHVIIIVFVVTILIVITILIIADIITIFLFDIVIILCVCVL